MCVSAMSAGLDHADGFHELLRLSTAQVEGQGAGMQDTISINHYKMHNLVDAACNNDNSNSTLLVCGGAFTLPRRVLRSRGLRPVLCEVSAEETHLEEERFDSLDYRLTQELHGDSAPVPGKKAQWADMTDEEVSEQALATMKVKKAIPEARLEEIAVTQEALQCTKMCNQMNELGQCKKMLKGKKCTFAHKESELRDRPNVDKTRLCVGAPKCTGASCKFFHPDRDGEMRVVG